MDKQTLKQYRALIREIEQLESEKQWVFDTLLSPKSPSGTPGGGSSQDKIGDAIARRDKYQRMIDAKMDELTALRERIEAAIEGLPSADRQLIRLRYIDGLTWERIAVDLSYSIQHVWRLHGSILIKMRDNESK